MAEDKGKDLRVGKPSGLFLLTSYGIFNRVEIFPFI
jgi:hypothetical protein